MKTIQEVIQQFPDNVREKYNFDNAIYTGALNRITGVVCAQHGAFSQYAAQFRKGSGCPTCGGQVRAKSRSLGQEQFILGATEKHNGQYDYSKTVYTNMTTKITVGCARHGDFIISPLKHYYEVQGCPRCAEEEKKQRIKKYRHLSADAKRNNTGMTFFERCSDRHSGLYTYPEQTYNGAKSCITAVCSTHGEFKQRAWKHLHGAGCPKCGGKSQEEDALAEWLRQYTTVEQRNRRVLSPKEVDLWLPEHNIAIEYHGLYWHTDTRVGDAHLQKWKLAEKKGFG